MFSFAPSATVITATVAEVSPSNFSPKVEIIENTVTISNTLWNGGNFYGIGGDRAILDFLVLNASVVRLHLIVVGAECRFQINIIAKNDWFRREICQFRLVY